MEATRRSPIEHLARAAGAELALDAGWLIARSFPGASTGGPGLSDESHWGKVLLHGRAAGRVAAALALEAPEATGGGFRHQSKAVYRLRADQLIVILPPAAQRDALRALLAANTGDEMVTVTDVTHGRAQFRLTGPGTVDLLSRLCALDFDDSRFPDGTARQTSVAKTTQLVIRDDLHEGTGPSYRLIGARSLAAYLWQTILEAGRDLGVRPLGWEQVGP